MPDVTLDSSADEPAPLGDAFAPGATVGHFLIVKELGAGGMGIVFEAYDPDLDRRVALKVVRGPDAGSAAGARLIREAQAMAKLTHPNVVGVHEVGTVGAGTGRRVFVVMELVRGETLATWLEHPRTWRRIVETFTQAGDGLLAAHHAGLVHRDFKPSNVLVEVGGRVRVTDFGLAFSDDDEEPPLARGSDLVGTPAFMAPEQGARGDVDARADQYSFAVSLDDALSRVPGRAPRRLRAAITRALADDREARFPSLEPLLAELRAAVGSRRRFAMAGALTLAGAAAVAASIALATTPAGGATCSDHAELVDELWNPATRDALAERFTRVRPSSTTAIASTARTLDAWTAAWKLGRRAACGADDAQRRARLACLDRGLHELRQQLVVWESADAEVVDRAVRAATALPAPESCTNAPPLQSIDPVTTQALVSIHALERAGRARDAKPAVDLLLVRVGSAPDPATAAEVFYAAGIVAQATGDLPRARAHLARAASEAGRAGLDARLVDSLLMQASVVIDEGRPLDSLGLLDAANAIIARVGIDRLERYATLRGDALTQAGRPRDAIVELRRAVELVEARAARDPRSRLGLARALGVLAAAHDSLHEHEEGVRLLARVLAIEEAELGPEHPDVGRTLHDLANHQSRLLQRDRANANLARARAIFVAAHGERHLLVGGTDLSLANLAVSQLRYDDARVYYERALATLSRVLPADHAYLASVSSGLGTIARDQDRCAEAIPHFERAVAILERTGHGGPNLATHLVNLGACLDDVGRSAEARKPIERSLALLDEAGVTDKEKTEQWMVLAEIELHSGNKPQAIAIAERLLARTKDSDGPAWAQMRAYARTQLAAWKR